MAMVAAPLMASAASGPDTGYASGFQLNRFDPTAPGEFSFMVSHPWFSDTRTFAAEIGVDYAHNPWVAHTSTGQTNPLVDNMLTGRASIAFSATKWMTFAASIPFTLLETGDGAQTVGINHGFALGDPKVSFLFRVLKDRDLYHSSGSIALGINAWIPLHSLAGNGGLFPDQSGDNLRIEFLKVMTGGIIGDSRRGHGMLWSADVGMTYRTPAKLGTAPASAENTIGTELNVGIAAGYANLERSISVVAEAKLMTNLDHAFAPGYNAFEVGLGAHVGLFKNCREWCITANLAGSAGIGNYMGLGPNAVGIPDFRIMTGFTVERKVKPVVRYGIPGIYGAPGMYGQPGMGRLGQYAPRGPVGYPQVGYGGYPQGPQGYYAPQGYPQGYPQAPVGYPAPYGGAPQLGPPIAAASAEGGSVVNNIYVGQQGDGSQPQGDGSQPQGDGSQPQGDGGQPQGDGGQPQYYGPQYQYPVAPPRTTDYSKLPTYAPGPVSLLPFHSTTDSNDETDAVVVQELPSNPPGLAEIAAQERGEYPVQELPRNPPGLAEIAARELDQYANN